MIRVGIVGYGFAGRGFHAYLIRRVPGLLVTAASTASPDRRAQAEADGVAHVHADARSLFADPEVDVVVLATPHDTHRDLAIEAMRAGKHVVIDKPMALTSADADQILVAQRETGRVLTVFHNRRFDWDYLTVQDVLAKGTLGDPYLFEVAVLRYKAPRGWRAHAEAGGGLFYDWGAHLVDQALQLVPGPVASVSADFQYRGWGKDAGSYARVLLRFGSGVLYGIEVGNLATILKPRWYVLGEAGALQKTGLDPQEPAMLTGDITAAGERPEDRAVVVTSDGSQALDSVRGDWTDFYVNLRDHLQAGAPLAVRPEEARRVIAVLEAATRAAGTHQVVELGL